MSTKLDTIVARYIALRDRKAQMKADYEKNVAEIDEALTRMERFFLTAMNDQGLESLPTAEGVPYKQKRTYVGISDWDSSLNFIKEKDMWHMLEHRINKTAVEQYVAANGDLPPGVTWREEVVVNVRRKA